MVLNVLDLASDRFFFFSAPFYFSQIPICVFSYTILQQRSMKEEQTVLFR